MKKAMQTALLLGLALLAGCAAPGAGFPASTPALTESPEAAATGPVDSAPWFATFPAQFGNVSAVEHTRTERDDRCGLYLQVLEDLWAVDEGLNGDITELGVDLSSVTDLSESEKAAVAWAFGNAHGLTPVEGTLEELWEQGYLTRMTEPAEGYADSLALYYWEGGVLFSVSGCARDGFNAQKWRSGLGAYFFQDCTAVQADDGTWTYAVGSEAIS